MGSTGTVYDGVLGSTAAVLTAGLAGVLGTEYEAVIGVALAGSLTGIDTVDGAGDAGAVAVAVAADAPEAGRSYPEPLNVDTPCFHDGVAALAESAGVSAIKFCADNPWQQHAANRTLAANKFLE